MPRRFALAVITLCGLTVAVACSGNAPSAPRSPAQVTRDRDLTAWIMAQDFAEDHIAGDFPTRPRSVQDTGDGGLLVSGDCATGDGVVHRIVAEVEHAGGDNWKCRELYIDAQRVR